jgi:hypothetical protein
LRLVAFHKSITRRRSEISAAFSSAADRRFKIAEAEKIGRSFVSRLLRLTLLAPDIQEAILEGRQPKSVQLEKLTGAVPGAWVSSPGEGIPTEMIPLGFIRRAQQQHDPAQRTRRP